MTLSVLPLGEPGLETPYRIADPTEVCRILPVQVYETQLPERICVSQLVGKLSEQAQSLVNLADLTSLSRDLLPAPRSAPRS